jgi:Pro-kumamolisin, activation domain/Bacterial Ig-like domain (group 3)
LRKLCSILSAPFLLVLAVCALQGSQAQAAVQDRITEAIESANGTPMAGTVHPLAKTEFDQGMADNAKVLEGMTLNFKRSAMQEANLQALLQAQQNAGSATYHKWLTPAQFGQQFGMSSADIAKASAWLQQEGFTVTAVSQSSNSISFSGSVASVERAFQTQIHNYTVNGEKHFANSTQISIPGALAGTVSSVRGLNDFRLKPRLQFIKARAAGINSHFTSGLTGGHYLAPGDFATIFDVSPLYTAGDTGKGETIAIIGQTDIVLADITDFRAAAGLTVNNPTVVTVPGSTPSSVATGAASNDLAETDLDLEWSGGVATGASVVLVNSADVFTSLQYAIQNTINGITIPIISQSYGNCEAGYQTSDLTTIDGFLAQANSQGQTVILAAGDTGAADCDDSSSTTSPIQSATLGLAVDYPGSSVYVTDLGGSEFMGDGTAAAPQTGSGTYWNSSGSGGVSDDLVTSAKSYIPEMAWNDTTYSISQNGGLSAGGGGVSSLWKKPTWQAGVPGIPADGFRDVPDVSLASSPDHDGLLYCTQVLTLGSGSTYVSSCQATSFRTADTGQTDNNNLTVAGGTSFAAPSFAGLLAIIEQKINSGGGLGNINPSLYTLASNATTYASAFHDITAGNNQVPCTAGSPNCGTTGTTNVIGYTAGTGYDQATGIGSIDANNLATSFAALVTATGTKTTLVATPGSSLVSGEKVTFTATVAPNTLSTAPTGTVTFTVDGTAEAPVTLSTAAPYTAALVETAGFTTGTHTVVATYTSADATYTGSTSSTITVTVASSGTAATTTVVTANPTTFALGGPVTLSATITGTTAGTLTGPLTFTTGGIKIGTVSQVTIGTGNTATATLNVANATASLGFAAGTDTITATYGGDTYNAVSSGTTTVTVTNPGITLSATNITISSANPGNSGTSTITLTSTGSYAGTAVVSASASSLDADYQFGTSGAQTASVVLAAGGTGTTTIEITTIAAGSLQKSKGNLRKTAGRIAAAGGTAAGCLLLLLIPGIRRKRWPIALAMLVFLSVGAGLGCGGGTGGATPGGTYTVTLTAADSSNANITGSTTFTVTIN